MIQGLVSNNKAHLVYLYLLLLWNFDTYRNKVLFADGKIGNLLFSTISTTGGPLLPTQSGTTSCDCVAVVINIAVKTFKFTVTAIWKPLGTASLYPDKPYKSFDTSDGFPERVFEKRWFWKKISCIKIQIYTKSSVSSPSATILLIFLLTPLNCIVIFVTLANKAGLYFKG